MRLCCAAPNLVTPSSSIWTEAVSFAQQKKPAQAGFFMRMGAAGLDISACRLHQGRSAAALFHASVLRLATVFVQGAQVDGMKAAARSLDVKLDKLAGFEA